MTIQQLSIFMENKPGQLVRVNEVLTEAGIDIRALSLADTTDFGIARMIVSDCEKAQQLLKENHFMSTITQVFCVVMDDQPGGLGTIAKLMNENGVNIDYLYACVTVIGEKAYVIMHVDNAEKADEVMKAAGIVTSDRI